MFKFLRRNKQQQRQQEGDPNPRDPFERNSSESEPEEDFEKEDELEEELKLLFESMSPESSDDYVGEWAKRVKNQNLFWLMVVSLPLIRFTNQFATTRYCVY